MNRRPEQILYTRYGIAGMLLLLVMAPFASEARCRLQPGSQVCQDPRIRPPFEKMKVSDYQKYFFSTAGQGSIQWVLEKHLKDLEAANPSQTDLIGKIKMIFDTMTLGELVRTSQLSYFFKGDVELSSLQAFYPSRADIGTIKYLKLAELEKVKGKLQVVFGEKVSKQDLTQIAKMIADFLSDLKARGLIGEIYQVVNHKGAVESYDTSVVILPANVQASLDEVFRSNGKAPPDLVGRGLTPSELEQLGALQSAAPLFAQNIFAEGDEGGWAGLYYNFLAPVHMQNSPANFEAPSLVLVIETFQRRGFLRDFERPLTISRASHEVVLLKSRSGTQVVVDSDQIFSGNPASLLTLEVLASGSRPQLQKPSL